ncbi:Uncharacterised protein [Chromobacterium violaceum]|uniref:Uncharacterized protein n=1 Tax=Chromobacterium violaceum TaxID=536 RepID=A0A447T4R4_CHRVL|nr:Uncharacterised protein [Chromobacterium violaceum]
MKTPWIKPVLASLAFGGWWLLLTLCRDRWVMVTLAAALLLWEALPSGLRGRRCCWPASAACWTWRWRRSACCALPASAHCPCG